MKRVFYGWWVVLICGFIGCVKTGIVSFGFTAFFEPLVKEFGWSYAQISFATSLRGVEMSFFAPIIGFLVDRFGSKKLIFSGVITVGFGLFLLSVTQSLMMFYGAFLLLAFGAGGVGGVVLMTTVATWFDRNMTKAFAVVSGLSVAGGLIVPLIVWIIDVYQWRTAFIILGLGVWILGIPLSFLIKDRSEHDGSSLNGKHLHGSTVHRKEQPRGSGIGLKEALKHKAFISLSIVEITRHMITSSVVLHVMPYLSSVGISRTTAGMVAGVIPVFSIVGRFGFGWIGDTLDKRYRMAAGFVLIAAGLLGLCFVQQGWAVLISVFFLSSGWGGSMILSRTIQAEYFKKEYFGRMLGILMGFGSIGGIIGPTLAGWVFDHLASYQFVWLLFSGFSVLSIWMILRMKPSKPS